MVFFRPYNFNIDNILGHILAYHIIAQAVVLDVVCLEGWHCDCGENEPQ